MKMISVILIFLMAFSLGCFKEIEHAKLLKMLSSENVSQIIEATTYVADHKDTSMVNEMLRQSDDPRITHLIHHYGMSVYQVKMGAMQKLTKLPPPHKIISKPDSANIKFYLITAIKLGWIKS